MTDFQQILLGYLACFCRGPRRARKVWRISEDLQAIGLTQATPRGVSRALAALHEQCVPVAYTTGDSAAAFLDECGLDVRLTYRARAHWWRRCSRDQFAFPEAKAAFEALAADYELLARGPLLAGLPEDHRRP